MDLEFEWDETKARRNEAKHGVTFEEAKTVFNDSLSVTIDDPEHSETEERWVDIGMSSRSMLLVVLYTEQSSGTIRIIGCRRATRAERRAYEHE